jgi:NADH-quinone oxidoreductase subunit M
MLDNLPLLSMITFSPLIGVFILFFIRSDRGNVMKLIAIITTLIPLFLTLWLYVNFDVHERSNQFLESMNWIQIPLNAEIFNALKSSNVSLFYELKYSMAVDGFSIVLVFLTALVSTMAALSSIYIKKRWKTFYILFLLLEMGMFGVFMAQDIVMFFLFFEITLIPVFFLIGIWGNVEKERAANHFLIYNAVGSALMFIAFLIIISKVGIQQLDNMLIYTGDYQTILYNMLNLGESNPFNLTEPLTWFLFILLVVAFGIKLPIFPFHSWMLKVHAQAPPSIVMIHSGVLLKMGAFGLIKFGFLLFPEQAYAFAFVFAILGIINILYGAILAFVQQDMRLVLAYSSISHMGIVLIGLASFSVIGLQGAIFQLVSHGLISAMMFLIVGMIYERTDTTELNQLGGLASKMPFISSMLLFAGLASLGLPGLSGFVAELLSLLALFGSYKLLTIIASLGIILTAVYVLRAILKITFGKWNENIKQSKDARFIEAIPMITLVSFIVLLGVYPAILTDPLQVTIINFDEILKNFSSQIGG